MIPEGHELTEHYYRMANGNEYLIPVGYITNFDDDLRRIEGSHKDVDEDYDDMVDDFRTDYSDYIMDERLYRTPLYIPTPKYT